MPGWRARPLTTIYLLFLPTISALPRAGGPCARVQGAIFGRSRFEPFFLSPPITPMGVCTTDLTSGKRLARHVCATFANVISCAAIERIWIDA